MHNVWNFVRDENEPVASYQGGGGWRDGGGGGDRKTPVVLPCLADYIIIRDAPTPNVRS